MLEIREKYVLRRLVGLSAMVTGALKYPQCVLSIEMLKIGRNSRSGVHQPHYCRGCPSRPITYRSSGSIGMALFDNRQTVEKIWNRIWLGSDSEYLDTMSFPKPSLQPCFYLPSLASSLISHTVVPSGFFICIP